MTSKPTILWVHGAWHTPDHFEPVIKVFNEAGYASVAPRLPSVGNVPPVSFRDDAQSVRTELQRLVEDEGRDVVVIGHSYGGTVANQAVDDHLAQAQRAKHGQRGGVVRVVFLTAVMPHIGQNNTDPFGGVLPPFIPVDEEGLCEMLNPEGAFYADMPKAEQDKWGAKCLKMPVSALQTPVTQVVYKAHPIGFVYCTQDMAIPYPMQQQMVQSVRDQYGVEVATQTLEAAHSPYLSMPDQLLTAVQKLVASAA